MAPPLLVVNPRSANGATGRFLDEIGAAVRNHLGEHAFAFTKAPGHATELTRAALREGRELIVAVGGDGTINEVVNGFFEPARPGEEPKPIRPGAALALLPRGTGGDFRRSLGLTGDLRKDAARLRAGRRVIDVGRADFTADDGAQTSRYFVNVSGAGVGAEVVRIANESSKALGGKLTFALASARALAGWSDVKVRASVDGGPFEELSVTSFSVANGRWFGGGMLVAPDAKLDDGLLHCTIWSGYGLADFVIKSARMYDGTHVKLPGTRVRAARTVRLEPGGKPSDRVARIEVDGEPCGRLPASYAVVPGALTLLG